MDTLLNLTIRDWMVIIGSLLIIAVVVDAWRRMRADKRSRVRMKLAADGRGGQDDRPGDLSLMRELPNGGARVLKREDLLAARAAQDRGQAAEESESEESQSPPSVAASAESTGTDASAGVAADDSGQEDYEPMAGVRPDRGEPANFDWLEDLQSEPENDDGGALPRNVETEVIILHVVAGDELGFDGKAILEILLACDLRFGDMEFFHRHEREAGRGPIQFSVANMLQPGVFDIDNMASMRTRGLVFFLTLPGPEDMGRAFDYMLETARTVARNLNGDVLDESRSALTEQSVALARQQIVDLERRMLAQPN